LLELALRALLASALLFAPAARATAPFVEVAAFVVEPAAEAPAPLRVEQQASYVPSASGWPAVAAAAAPRQHARARRVEAPLYVMHCAFLR
jgi:hypothetical protein